MREVDVRWVESVVSGPPETRHEILTEAGRHLTHARRWWVIGLVVTFATGGFMASAAIQHWWWIAAGMCCIAASACALTWLLARYLAAREPTVQRAIELHHRKLGHGR